MKIVDNLKKRQTENEVEIDGRNFIVEAFDPLMGNYIAVTLLTMAMPFGIGDMLSSKIGMPPAKEGSKVMNKADFLELQRDILKYAKEVLPGRNAPVINENGSYGIEDFTMGIALKLLIAVISFNFSDFFGESPSNAVPTAP